MEEKIFLSATTEEDNMKSDFLRNSEIQSGEKNQQLCWVGLL